MATEAGQVLIKLRGVFPRLSSRSGGSENWEENGQNISNLVFRLHSHVTFVFLLLSSALTFAQQMLGVHIKCLMPTVEEELRASAVTTYCFVTGTYTVDNPQGLISSHPGVSPHIKGVTQQKFHHYFQWVPYMLLLYGVLFTLPNLLWKNFDKGKIRKIIRKIHEEKKQEEEEEEGNAAKYFVDCVGYNKTYAGSYIFCEILNLFFVLVTFWGLDFFLSGQFQDYGWKYFNYRRMPGNLNPMDQIFPKVTKCQFNKFGPSGQVVKYDILCILAVNVINEKIFLGLWAWLIFLFCTGVALLICRGIIMIFQRPRSYILICQLPSRVDKGHEALKKILGHENFRFSDWFLLKRISDNLGSYEFSEFCVKVWESLEKENLSQFGTQEEKHLRETSSMETTRRRNNCNKFSTSGEYITLQNYQSGDSSLKEITVHSNEELLNRCNYNV